MRNRLPNELGCDAYPGRYHILPDIDMAKYVNTSDDQHSALTLGVQSA